MEYNKMSHYKKAVYSKWISCQVLTEAGKAKANISFENHGFEKITAVKFNAKGYNLFGDVVNIFGKPFILKIGR